MTFYEQELRKIIGERYPDATYVGRACYVRLSDMNRAKIQFVTGIVANQYNALQLTIPQPQRRTGGYPAPSLFGSAGDKDDLKSQLPKWCRTAHLG